MAKSNFDDSGIDEDVIQNDGEEELQNLLDAVTGTQDFDPDFE